MGFVGSNPSIHSWSNADLYPVDRRRSDHGSPTRPKPSLMTDNLAVPAIDPWSIGLPHTKFEPTISHVFAHISFVEICKKDYVEDAVTFIDVLHGLLCLLSPPQ